MHDDTSKQSQQGALVARAAEGDADAFEQLIGPLQRPLFGYALRLCGDPHVAEDLCQDAFIKAFRGIASFTGNSALATWLYRILHNTWLDHIKKGGRQALDLTDPPPELQQDEPPALAREAVNRFFEQMRGESAQERVAEALADLTPLLREVVVLRDIKGCSYDEIASITGLAAGTVKSRISRGREQLKGLLIEYATVPNDPVKK